MSTQPQNILDGASPAVLRRWLDDAKRRLREAQQREIEAETAAGHAVSERIRMQRSVWDIEARLDALQNKDD